MRERPQSGHIHAGHGDAGQSTESDRREQAVTQRHAEAGQRAEDARGEIELPGGSPVGQANERDDDEHIASGGDPREPTGLRVGQRPGLDELRQQRRNNRESGQRYLLPARCSPRWFSTIMGYLGPASVQRTRPG
jgi:hypothetical protein